MTPITDTSREARAIALFADIVAERLPDTAKHIRAGRGDGEMLTDITRAMLAFATAEQQRIPDGEIERLREHIAEQITHVETRIQDGKEMGAAVWRIALEDIARENRAALQPHEVKP